MENKKKTYRVKNKKKQSDGFRYTQELVLLGVIVLTLISFISVFTPAVDPLGAWFRQLFGGLFGRGVYLLPFIFIAVISHMMIKKTKLNYKHYMTVTAFVILSAGFQLIDYGGSSLGFDIEAFWISGADASGGGVLGGLLYAFLYAISKNVGAVIFIAAGLIASVLIIFNVSLFDALGAVGLQINRKMSERKKERKQEKKKFKVKIEKPTEPDIAVFDEDLHNDNDIEEIE